MTKEPSEKQPMTPAEMGRKGGNARAKNLTKEQISAISRKAGIASGKARKQKTKDETNPIRND